MARIVIEEPCEHGRTDSHNWLGPVGPQYPDPFCPGGSRRVLDPGSLVDLIDKHTQAIIDGLGAKNVVVAPGMSVALDLGILDLDALAGGEQP